jgi:hypothetical protein
MYPNYHHAHLFLLSQGLGQLARSRTPQYQQMPDIQTLSRYPVTLCFATTQD